MHTSLLLNGRLGKLGLLGWAGALLLCSSDVLVAADVEPTLRIATYNVDLSQSSRGQLAAILATPDDQEARNAAEVIQRVNPDIILLNEFDYDAQGKGIARFLENYLGVSQNGLAPVEFKYVYNALPPADSATESAMNTGVQPEDEFRDPKLDFDFDNNKGADRWEDAFGFGSYPGKYGLVILSKFPIRHEDSRSFQTFLWKDMPDAQLPPDPTDADGNRDRTNWYTPAELAVFRLSSKTHLDVPVDVNGRVIHVLASHPTPPAFDKDPPGVDWNKRRNFDEIRFWADYVSPGASDYIYDDHKRKGRLEAGASFVILGDLNADEDEGTTWEVKGVKAIEQLTRHPRINHVVPTAPAGGGGADPDDTATFVGNIRADYVLPSLDLMVVDDKDHTGVFWPAGNDPQYEATLTSDHRLVYVDLSVE